MHNALRFRSASLWRVVVRFLIAAAALVLASSAALAQRRMENLGRGVVAVRSSNAEVFVSWRLLGHEPRDLPFNIYRSTAGGVAQKLNEDPLVEGTNFVDATVDAAQANAYFVRPVVDGVELVASAGYTLAANAPVRPYFALPLAATPWDTYVHLVWVGDLDGDGEYDFVVSRLPLVTGRSQLLDAYKRDGTFLWRVDFGPNSVDPDNIEPPASTICAGHNDGVTVYDLDGDGRAEVVIKSANGVTFGDGATLAHGDNVTQFVSVLDGLTGDERARSPMPTDYLADGPLSGHFGIAYLDGVKPSFVFKAKNRIGSGNFNLLVATWDFDGANLTRRWTFAPGEDKGDYPNFHQIRIVDVDGDGKDEICDGGYVLDDDGSVLYSLGPKGVVHGDRFHIGDLDPARSGLEGFGIQQNNASGLLYYVYDAATGEMIRQHFGPVEDLARGTAADLDPAHRGYEYWSFHGIHEIAGGTVVSPDPQRPWPNFRIWWDGDVLSENLNREIVEKWNPATGSTVRLLTASQDGSVDSWRDAAQFYGDILGDWREEIVYEKSDHSALLIYTTSTPSSTRLYTLPHNPEYRACFTVKGYLQSHMVDYYLGDGMAFPPAPNIVPVLGATANAPVIVSFEDDTGVSSRDRITNDNTPTMRGIALPGAQVVVSRIGLGDLGTATADASGAWSLGVATPLPDGAHYFLARMDGQVGASVPFAVEVDTAAPAAPVVQTVMAGEGSALVVSGVTEPGFLVEVSISGIGVVGTATADASGRWSFTYEGSPLSSGNDAISARAFDTAGNPSTAADYAVDPLAVVPRITTVADDTGVSSTDRITSDPTPRLSGTAAPGSEVRIFRFGEGFVGTSTADASGAWSFAYDALAHEDGVYVFSAFSAGGIGAPSFAVTVDGTAPRVSSVERVSPSSASSSATAVTFRVSFSESVVGLDASDFTAVFGGGLSGVFSSVEPYGSSAYDVTIGSLDGEGTVRLDLNASGTGVADFAGNPLVDGYSTGAVFSRVLLGDGVWTRSATGGRWSDNANWLGGVVAHGAGTTADFSTLELPETSVVHLDAPHTVTNLVFGDEDITSAASWLVDPNGIPSNALTLVSGASTPAITVNPLGTGARAVVSAPLAGTNGFGKDGAGTLVLSGSGTLTGSVSVNAGILRVEEGGRLTPSSLTLSGSGSVLTVAGGSVEASGAASVNNASNLVVESGVASFSAINASNNTGNTVRVTGGLLVAGSISFQRSTDGSLNYNTGLVVRGGEVQVGAINLGTSNSNGMMSVEGGVVTATGAVSLGNQSSGGRGGHLRVANGVFLSTDGSASGGLIVVRRNNNAATLNILGGVSAVERLVLGFDSNVILGTGTVNLEAGELYLGAGGIVRNGAGAFVSNVNLAGGLLGANAPWSSALAMNLAGLVTLKAADVEGAPFDFTLTGALSGAGGFVKTGAGVLTLGGIGSFVGAATVEEGTLLVSGSLGGAGLLSVNSGAVLAGNGVVSRPVVLNDGGSIAPDGAAAANVLTLASLDWHAGGALAFDLGAAGVSDRLVVTGALAKAGEGSRALRLNASAALVPGSEFALATFGSTTLSASDLSVAGLQDGYGASVQLSGSELRVVIVALPVVTSGTSAQGVFGVPFSYAIAAENAPTRFVATGLPPGLSLDEASGVVSGVPAAAGTFVVALGAQNEAGTGTASLTLTISKAVASVSLGLPTPETPVRRFYTGSALGASATTAPAGLGVVFTYNGGAEAPVLPGVYDLIGTIDDPNYSGSVSGKFIVVTTVLAKRAIALNGEIDGSVQLTWAENASLNSGALISSDLLVPGSPQLQRNGQPSFVGLKDASGASIPSSYSVTLNGGSALRYLVRRVDPLPLPDLAALGSCYGLRDVVLDNGAQAPGDFATLRDLTLNGGAGSVSVPPGTYGRFVVNGGNSLVLGVSGASEPAVYELRQLTLNGNATLSVVGPVVLRFGESLHASGVLGSADHPRWLTLQFVSGGLVLNGTSSAYAEVIAPKGSVTLNGGATLYGNIVSESFVSNSGSFVIEPETP